MKKSIAIVVVTLFATAAFAAKVERRQVHQQKRIAQGVKSGQLTSSETANLEHKEAKLQAEKHDMREDNGGKLTAADKAKLNHQQNVLSKDIYKDKHNNRKRQ